MEFKRAPRGSDVSAPRSSVLALTGEGGGIVQDLHIARWRLRSALTGERVRAPRRLARTEALAELALRYFTGHGPATERDLAYWATLTFAI